tara:strand:- start:2263 stop:2577 length:315 start_codon:yes stop_codon:yes gene_type:complete
MSRINIAYSIEIDELEEEVQRLLSRASDAMKATAAQLKEIVDHKDTSLTVARYEEIDEVRTALAGVDHTLGDLNSIINSYNVYHLGQLNAAAPVMDSEADADTP